MTMGKIEKIDENELTIVLTELAFQKEVTGKLETELAIARRDLAFQSEEKVKRAAELVIADIELDFQNKEKGRREIINRELEALSYSAKLASQYSLSLIEASRDPMFTISPEGKITDMNNASVKITELSREGLIGTDFINYFTEPGKAREGYQQIFAKGFVADYPLTIKDGVFTDVLFNGSVYKDDRGNVLGAVVVARVITEQKRIEKELTEAKEFAELATKIAEEAKGKAESRNENSRRCCKSQTTVFIEYEPRNPHANECDYWIYQSGFENKFVSKAKRILNGYKNEWRCINRPY